MNIPMLAAGTLFACLAVLLIRQRRSKGDLPSANARRHYLVLITVLGVGGLVLVLWGSLWPLL